jgi:branched-subunit amino acid ABC-type transport system permease component
MDHIAASLLGLGNGGTFAALALAIVLTYRASGVINFATGAQALYAAYTYAFLREGKILLIIPGLPLTAVASGRGRLEQWEGTTTRTSGKWSTTLRPQVRPRRWPTS